VELRALGKRRKSFDLFRIDLSQERVERRPRILRDFHGVAHVHVDTNLVGPKWLEQPPPVALFSVAGHALLLRSCYTSFWMMQFTFAKQG
jgi:hypothetical protein